MGAKMRGLAVAVAVLAFIGWTSHGLREASGAEMYSKFTPNDIAEILRGLGYRAEVIIPEKGNPSIRSGMAGWDVLVFLYSCEPDGCMSLEYNLTVRKDPRFSLALLNTWNMEKRFAKTFLEKNGNITLSADVYFNGGVSRDLIIWSARFFEDSAGSFLRTMSAK
jgi:hypothetical protein